MDHKMRFKIESQNVCVTQMTMTKASMWVGKCFQFFSDVYVRYTKILTLCTLSKGNLLAAPSLELFASA